MLFRKQFKAVAPETPPIPGAPVTESVTDFGAKGNGTTDDLAAIQSCIDAVAPTGGRVFFPAGTYLIKGNLILKGGIIYSADPGTAKILINNSFSSGSAYFPHNEGAIINANLALAYNEDTADEFTISGLDFEQNQTTMTIYTTALFANVKNVVIEDCNFTAPGTARASNLDFYAVHRNTIIRRCNFSIMTGHDYGSHIMIRNMTGNGAAETNYAADVLVEDCVFDKDCKDEGLCIWGKWGILKNIKVQNCDFKFSGDSVVVYLGIFCDEESPPNPNAQTENIIIKNNKFNVPNAFTVVKLHQEIDTVNALLNVQIIDNEFIFEDASSYTYVIFAQANQHSDDLAAIGNVIKNLDAANEINYGIAGLTTCENNVLLGLFEAGIFSVGSVENNLLDGTFDKGILNCLSAKNNIVRTAGGEGVNYFGDNRTYLCEGNNIAGAVRGISIFDVSGGNPTVTVKGCAVSVPSGSSFSFVGAGTMIDGGNNTSQTVTYGEWAAKTWQ